MKKCRYHLTHEKLFNPVDLEVKSTRRVESFDVVLLDDHAQNRDFVSGDFNRRLLSLYHILDKNINLINAIGHLVIFFEYLLRFYLKN